jgi:Protein of unknown function (DUF2971)
MPKSRKHLARRNHRHKRKPRPPSSIAAFFEQTVLKANQVSSHPFLYHYTSLAGAKGILESQIFRSSAHDCTNDDAELNSANAIVIEVAKACRQSAKGTAAKVLDILLNNYPDSMFTNLRTVYLSCFSIARDDESQWKNYGDNGVGICLGIRVLKEKPIKSAEVVSSQFQVEYSEAALRHWIDETFKNICSALAGYPPLNNNLEEGLSALYRIAAFASIRTKAEKWRSEQEMRYVTFSRHRKSVTPKERVSATGKIIRYLEVPLRADGKLIALDEIIIGANQNVVEVREQFEKLLAAKGYRVGSIEYPRISTSEVLIDVNL